MFRPKIERLKSYGLLTENEQELALTPLGTFFADEVAEQFNDPKYMPFPRSEYDGGPAESVRGLRTLTGRPARVPWGEQCRAGPDEGPSGRGTVTGS